MYILIQSAFCILRNPNISLSDQRNNNERIVLTVLPTVLEPLPIKVLTQSYQPQFTDHLLLSLTFRVGSLHCLVSQGGRTHWIFVRVTSGATLFKFNVNDGFTFCLIGFLIALLAKEMTSCVSVCIISMSSLHYINQNIIVKSVLTG